MAHENLLMFWDIKRNEKELSDCDGSSFNISGETVSETDQTTAIWALICLVLFRGLFKSQHDSSQSLCSGEYCYNTMQSLSLYFV